MLEREGKSSVGWRTRATAIVFAVAAAVGLLGIGMVFSSSFSASRIATNARALHWTNATLGAAGIARASVAQSVFFAFDERLGVSSPEAKDAAIAEARRDLEPVAALLESPDRPDGSPILDQISDFLAISASVVDVAETGDPDRAEGDRLTVLEPVFAGLRDALTARQTDLAQTITDSEDAAGRVARITQLVITFLIPTVAMVAFWWLLRRRMLVREIELEAYLDSERELSVAKDEFIAGLSHELRTPLTTIYGFSDLILQGDGMDPETREMLGLINLGSADLKRMVDDLLMAARIDADALSWRSELIDLAEQVDIVLAPYRRSGEIIESSIPEIEVYADPLYVRQIVHNLVSNARRHGGPRLLISARPTGGKAALVVADNGPGVPAEAVEHLFERFVHRGRRAMVAGSVGLGLAVSKELAMRMGGTITYDRTHGWSTFTLFLPHYPSRGRAHVEVNADDLVSR